MKKALVEFIGTFFLVLTVSVAAVQGKAGMLAPLAIGAVLMVMVYAGGHVSGGHYNPAVTAAVWLRGGMKLLEVPVYWVAQLLGAAAAVGASMAFASDAPAEPPSFAGLGSAVIFGEFLFTFALAWAVLNTATAKATAGNSYFGLAIGFTVAVGAMTIGPVTLGAFNPAVAVGLGMHGLLPVAAVAVYVAAQLLAGLVAAAAFRFLVPADGE